MKIKKVDDKPMVIHTKKKAKIHTHDTKAAKIKGSNIYTVERGPKTAGAKATETDKKKTYRRSTIHQSKARGFRDLSVILGKPILPSRQRIPIFILLEEQEHLQLEQLRSKLMEGRKYHRQHILPMKRADQSQGLLLRVLNSLGKRQQGKQRSVLRRWRQEGSWQKSQRRKQLKILPRL